MYILFFLLWIIFNGQITLEIVVFGILISAAMYAFICKFMDYSFKKERIVLREAGYIIEYLTVLFWEIVKANMETIRFIIARKHKNQPVLVSFTTDLKTRTAKAILANSITLTPGTITVSLEGNKLVVHCLDKSFSKGLKDSSFVHILTRMEATALKMPPTLKVQEKEEGSGKS